MIREITYSSEGWIDTWVFDCGWRIKGCHPYRMILFGEQILDQPIGIVQFYKETGILPPKPTTKSGLKVKRIYIDLITEKNILNGRDKFFKRNGNPKKIIFRVKDDLLTPEIHKP